MSPSATSFEQLLPNILDDRARVNPDGIFAKFSRSPTTYDQGFRCVSYIELVNAKNRIAWLLEERFGKGQDFPTIAYIGPADLRYSIVVVAGIKIGYKIFLPSPRNSIEAHLSLLTRLNCSRLVVTSPELPCIAQISESYDIEKFAIPSLQELLDSRDVPPYPYSKLFREARNDPVFVLHTSGSTGIPKPLIYSNDFVAGIARNTSIEAPEGYHVPDRFFRTGSFFMTLPGFHIAGIGFSLVVPSFQSSVPVYPLPTAPPTVEGLIQAASNTDIDWAFVPPVVLVQLAENPALLDAVSSRLKYFFYTGGGVPKLAGDVITQKMGLYQCLGSSECAIFPLIRPLSDQTCNDWNYVQVHPAIKHEFRHRFDNLHELVVIKSADHGLHQPVFKHFPESNEYETRDLFAPHPTKPNLWNHKSRIDDVIVFLNGEKTNPISFEQEVARHPDVQAALVGGSQRFEACLLIELNEDKPLSHDQRQAKIEKIWPTIERANSVTPAHARISKSKLLFADSSTPFPRAGKGTIQRRAAMDLYAAKIEELYEEPDLNELSSVGTAIDLTDRELVTNSVSEGIKAVTNWSILRVDDELFSLGMDSLQVLRLARQLRSKFGLASISARNIYANPSVDQLTDEIIRFGITNRVNSGEKSAAMTDVLPLILENYEEKIDEIAMMTTKNLKSPVTSRGQPQVVLLTGSTGALGSHLLDTLLSDSTVSHVYCLNRSDQSLILQKSRNLSNGLSTDLTTDRVSFITADFSKPDFGLDHEVIDVLRTSTTLIIHNAWPVDFNKSLQSFQLSLDSVLNLASFAAHASLSPSLLFVSSISSVANFKGQASVPESIILDFSAPASMGYGQSKYLAERILGYATSKLQFKAGAVRVGQISGTANNPRGWNRNEWFPSLVLSSRYLRALPESLGSTGVQHPLGMMGDIDWIPIDLLAGVIVEFGNNLCEGEARGALEVFHAINPHPVPWTVLIPTVVKHLDDAASTATEKISKMKIVSYSKWFDLLRSAAKDHPTGVDEEVLGKNPGIKLLDFYESLLRSDLDQGQSLAKLDLTHSLEVSGELARLPPIQSRWLSGWIENWLL